MVLTTFVPIQETRHNVCAVLYADIAVIAFCKGYRSSWYSLRSCPFTNFGTPCVLVFISVSTFAQAQVERCGTRRWLVPIQETRQKAWYFAVAHTTAQTSARLACSFLYPFQRLRKRKLNGYKKLSAHYVCTQ